MKELFLVLAVFLFSANISAGEHRERYWFCRQNGSIGDNGAMMISFIWNDSLPNHYNERQTSFAKYVKDGTKGSFVPSFEAKCREYYHEAYAKKHRKIELNTGHKYKVTIMEFKWRWDPSGGKGSKKP